MRRKLMIAALAPGILAPGLMAGVALAPAAALAQEAGKDLPENLAAIHGDRTMNGFRRFRAEKQDEMFAFYTDAVGLEATNAFTELRVYTFKNGQFKLNPRTDDRDYVDGGVADATGVRMYSFYFPDEQTVIDRFTAAGLDAPEFTPVPGSTRSIARVTDPDGMPVELVAVPGEPDAADLMEVSLTVSDMETARDFYENFAGLQPIAPEEDPVSGVTKTRYKQGLMIISLRDFDADLPPDTGGGGLQHVVSDVRVADGLAKARGVQIDQPLSVLEGYDLHTIWLSDPDGIINYFAQLGPFPSDED